MRDDLCRLPAALHLLLVSSFPVLAASLISLSLLSPHCTDDQKIRMNPDNRLRSPFASPFARAKCAGNPDLVQGREIAMASAAGKCVFFCGQCFVSSNSLSFPRIMLHQQETRLSTGPASSTPCADWEASCRVG